MDLERPMGYRFDWAWSVLGLVFMGLGWAGLKTLEPMTNYAGQSPR